MPRARAVNPSDVLPRATLNVVAKVGWAALTLEMVAKAAKLPLVQVQAVAADKAALLPMIVAWVDGQVSQTLGPQAQTFGLGPEVPGELGADGTRSPAFAEDLDQAEGLSPRDQAFEAIMARIDVLQSERVGFVRLMGDVRTDPCAWVGILPGVFAAMGGMGTGNAIYSIGNTIIYAMTLRVWMKDETQDLSITMAELDRRLGQGERLMGMFSPQS